MTIYRSGRSVRWLALLVLVAAIALAFILRGSSRAQAIDGSAFSSGACVAYPPTSGHRGKTVFLDAGHGGIDPGAVGSTESGQTVHEADVTLPIELDAMRLLTAGGFRDVVSRTRAESVVRLTNADAAGTGRGILPAIGEAEPTGVDYLGQVLAEHEALETGSIAFRQLLLQEDLS